MARPGTRATALSGALVLALGLGACSKDDQPSPPAPSSAFPNDTGALPSVPAVTGATASGGTPTGATATGPTGIVPTTPPGSAAGNLGTGRAAITVTGDVRASKALPNLVSAVYAPPPGGMAIVWTAGGADATTLGLGGLSFTGAQPTAPTLSLTLTVQTEGAIASFVSTAGECIVTISAAAAGLLSGRFDCSGLVGSAGEVVDASGSFSGRG